MATISELNVRLGLLYKDFDKSLSAVEKRLERSGRKFSQLGNDLTLAITAPLAALGASAIQQAGEIESLKLAMVSTFDTAGRSAAEATAEVEALRQAAKEPGLDFEQAVRGSVRLQGVGIAAEEAREILVQMANAVASTGGTAQELDGVTRQFAQIIAKGRVLQEDVAILAENMPVISRFMQQAFGTASVEAIRNMGVSGKEFVDRITQAAATLPRVEGGIKNALVNAGAEARNSLAALGEAISKAFDLPKTLDDLTKGLADVVAWFKSLDESTQRTIVQIGAFAVAAGPAVKIIGAISGAASQAISIFGAFAGGLKTLAGGIISVTSSAINMRIALIAATGGIAAVVLGIAAAVSLLASEFDAAEYATEQFKIAQEAVNKEAAKEVGQLNKNIQALQDVRTTTEDRKKAADALLAAYPAYLKGVDLEKASLERLNEIQQTLTQNIIRGIAERKKADAVNAVYEKQAEILLRIQEIQRTGQTTVAENTLIDAGDLIKNGSRAGAIIEKLRAQVADLSKEANTVAADYDKAFGIATRSIDPLLEKEYRARQSADDARDAFLGFGDAVKKSSQSASTVTGNAGEKAQKMADAYRSVLKSIDAVNKKQEELGAEFIPEKTREIESGVEKLLEAGYGPSSKPVQQLKGYLAAIRAEIGKGFDTSNAAQIAAADVAKVSAAIGELQRAQENAAGRKKAIEELAAAYPEYLRGIDLEKAGLEELDEIQKRLTKSILEAAQSRGTSVSATVDVSGAISELSRLSDVPEIAAKIDISGALAELQKLTQGAEIAASVDVSGALAQLRKLSEFPEISVQAGVDVSGALAELEKLRAFPPVTPQVDVAEATAEINLVSRALDVLRSKDSGAELRAGAIASLNSRYPDYLRNIDLERAGVDELNAAQKDLVQTVLSAAGAKVGAIIPQVDTAAAVQEIDNLRTAIDALRNSKTGDTERAEAIRQLTDAYPEYLRGIDLEKAGVSELTALQNRLTETIVSAAAARSSVTAPIIDTTEAQKQVADLAASLDVLRNTSGGDSARAAAIKTLTDAYPEYLQNIDLEKAGIAELVLLQNTLTAAIGKTAQARAQKPTAAPGAVPQVATLPTATAVQSFEISGAEQAIEQAKEFADSLNLVQTSFDNLSGTLSEGSGIDQMRATFAELKNGAITFGQAIQQSAEQFQQAYGQVAQNVYGQISQIAEGIVQIQANRAEQEKAILDAEYAAKIAAAKGNATAIEGLQRDLAAKKAKIDKDIAKKEQNLAIVQAVINTALGVTEALGSAPPPFNFVLAALVAAAGAVQIATIKSQAFAEGGVVTKPTLGLVGEYPGAQRNPEIISPERKMRAVFRDEMASSGGPTELYSIIRDDHLLLATERAARRRGRAT